MRRKRYLEWLSDMIDVSLRHSPEKTEVMLRSKISSEDEVTATSESEGEQST